MFVHQSQLRHLLRPDQYVTDEQYRTELQRLFLPAWHPVASEAELPRPGDFLTITLFGRPILLRNVEDTIRAYLNVCPHRHSALTDMARGHSPRFHCQYHGWEYAADGRTAKIPDARAFRPWDRDNARLTTFPTDRCGGIVYVKLTDGGPSLREFLDPLWDDFSTGFVPPYRYAGTWETDFACNWKVVLENSLESYHIPEVHPKTFVNYPDEADCEHDLRPEASGFTTPVPRDRTAWIQDWLVRRLGQRVTARYAHKVLHPHVTFNGLDVYRMVQCVFPTGPDTCRYRAIMYSLAGPKRGPLARLVAWGLRPVSMAVAKKVYNEDAAIYGVVQKGLAASPHRGVIGNREERIYVFQQFVLDKCGQAAGPDPAAEANGCGGCPAAADCAVP